MEWTQKHLKNNIVITNYEHTDQFALVIHYKIFHKENILKQNKKAYKVQFLERPVRNNFDFAEQWWI